MKRVRVILSALRHHWRVNVALAAGIAVGAAVLTGALMANDSVRQTLTIIATRRLGLIQYAMSTGDRYVTSALAERMADVLAGRVGHDAPPTSAVRVASALVAEGSISAPTGRFLSGAQIIGVGADFLGMEPRETAPIGTAEAYVNDETASQLGIQVGDTIVVRTGTAPLMPGEAPFATGTESITAFRLRVARILSPDELGGFSLRTSQQTPTNVFVKRESLAEATGVPGRANLILIGGDSVGQITPDELADVLDTAFQGSDAGLVVSGTVEYVDVTSRQAFIPPAIESALEPLGAEPILTYLVDGIVADSRDIPYSFVSTTEIDDGSIVLNSWAAADLGVGPGDRVSLDYRAAGSDNMLHPGSADFVVAGVREIAPTDRGLVPPLPGLQGVDSCSSWDVGFALDLDRIRDQDETYWDTYGGSPKAFISYETARTLFGSRYGDVTTLRMPAPAARGQLSVAAVEQSIAGLIDPAEIGFRFDPVRRLALDAAGSGTDFGQLFLALSFYLIAASILLVFQIARIAIRDRDRELGTFLALGFTRRGAAWTAMSDTAIVVGAGGVVGVLAGYGYGLLVVRGLMSVWVDATRLPLIVPDLRPSSAIVAFIVATATGALAIWNATRRASREPVSNLLAGGAAVGSQLSTDRGQLARALPTHDSSSGARPTLVRRITAITGIAAVVASAASVTYAALTHSTDNLPLALVSGTCALTGGVILFVALATRLGAARQSIRSSRLIGVLAALRRPTRSVTVVSVFAASLFILALTGAYRRSIVTGPDDRDSGTGGFSFYVESSVPVFGNAASLIGPDYPATIVGLRAVSGDDASCLNINHVVSPRILGVHSADLDDRFSFASVAPGSNPSWGLLDERFPDGAIPAIADQTVITWGLELDIGDELAYVDERGETVRLRLVAGLESSVFQGSVLVSSERLIEHFPSSGGARVLLAETTSHDPAEGSGAQTGSELEAQREALGQLLARTGIPYGFRIDSTVERLNTFLSVQNTYISIFQVLGAMGVLLGAVGVAAAVIRSVNQNRGEYAVLRAVGFARSGVMRAMTGEYVVPYGVGLLIGILSGILVAAPAISTRGMAAVGILIAVAGGALGAGLVAIRTALAIALRSDFLEAIRDE